MKSSWIVCALLANMSFEQAKATQIAQTSSHRVMGNLMPLEDDELVNESPAS